ncbi:hypothetical protein BC937DRAFT_90375 [Endogone sp. FLAS-F59071]|nr:hypothetical protein BC937DRAFT_90375 [Endogone sp. FLAS-F59071]|eukprot:RUS17138.1 hypothetical protein BC937DRAFT_90375 [Endogone sp. FLAS-F59071]
MTFSGNNAASGNQGNSFTGTVINDGQEEELTNSSGLAGPSQGTVISPASVASITTQVTPPPPTRAEMTAMFAESTDPEVVILRHFLLGANLPNGNDEGEPEWD